MKLGGNTRHATRKNFASLGGELGKKFWVSRYHLIGGDVMTAARHFAVRLTEIDAALDCFRLGHVSEGAG